MLGDWGWVADVVVPFWGLGIWIPVKTLEFEMLLDPSIVIRGRYL